MIKSTGKILDNTYLEVAKLHKFCLLKVTKMHYGILSSGVQLSLAAPIKLAKVKILVTFVHDKRYILYNIIHF